MLKHLLLLIGLLLLAGCGGTPQPTPEPTPTPRQMLEKSADAVLALQSARFRLLREGPPATLDPTLGLTFSEATGDYQAPDRVAAVVKAGAMGIALQVTVRWLPEGVFMTNPLTNEFGPAPENLGVDGRAIFGPEGFPAVLRTGLQNPLLEGSETLDGIATWRLTAEADGSQLATLTANALAGETTYPVTVWLAQSDNTPVRLQVQEADGTGWLIDLYDFNAPIVIEN
jgi:hypothetical protein